MEPLPPPSYIPVGCLVFPVDVGLWPVVGLQDWLYFGSNDSDPTNSLPRLPDWAQKLLLASPVVSEYAGLLDYNWIRMSFSSSLGSSTKAVIRIFILADDMDNRLVPRSDRHLHQQRLKLMNQLDLSASTWHGETRANSALSSGPLSPDTATEDSASSLLQLFNNIPSPNPALRTVQDLDYQDAISNVLESNVFGLLTTLYPYQRRSVAVMLQREAQLQLVPDPRLHKRVDHSGSSWYYDSIAGTVRRETRYYDSPLGGILAEQMGSGKTLMCLALCLATKHIPSKVPDHHWTDAPVNRRQVGTLADMAAACITKNSVPWKHIFDPDGASDAYYYPRCINAIQRNPGSYMIQREPPQLRSRSSNIPHSTSKVYLSHASLVIVPPNLVQQWQQEISKHTKYLRLLVYSKPGKGILPVKQLQEYDIILFSSTNLEYLAAQRDRQPDGSYTLSSPLTELHFKRCIIDEGHKLGNTSPSYRTKLQDVLDCLHFTSPWVVTGTPSKGLFGVDNASALGANDMRSDGSRHSVQSWTGIEKEDLRRIGSITQLYLKARPWANKSSEGGDTPAEWSMYMIQSPRKTLQRSRPSLGQSDVLKATLESLIIRHRLSDISGLLPVVEEKAVYLEPSYQDTLVLNLFSAMIIFNSVQSQRTDQDYFFHPKQRKALMQLVSNLRQASFFGGSFYSPADILKAVDTAETFLKKGKFRISAKDESLLRQAIEFGKFAAGNMLKGCAYRFHEIPVFIKHFPLDLARHWSVIYQDGDPVCLNTRMVAALQRAFERYQAGVAETVHVLSQLVVEGMTARHDEEESQGSNGIDSSGIASTQAGRETALAGNTQLGEDKTGSKKLSSRMQAEKEMMALNDLDDTGGANASSSRIPAVFAQTQIVSTASAKLSYLVDQIVQHHREEQILIFYDNDNIAFYLAEMLELLQIQHLIYSKHLDAARQALYIETFNTSPKFRVLLMDISRAAFGLDMRSASRVYFINPVLNRQVEAQAIGRARRIGQTRPVTVETLVLRGSIEEVILRRSKEMTLEEQRKCHTILDDKGIYQWILNAKILPLPGWPVEPTGPDQMAKLKKPQLILGRGVGREAADPDQDLVPPPAKRSAGNEGWPVDGPQEEPVEEPAGKRVRFLGI